MQGSNGHYPYDEDDRKNRFLSPINTTEPRATSQPPQGNAQGFGMSPTSQHPIPSSLGGGGPISPWARSSSGLNPNARPMPQSVPGRSSSFSAHNPSQFSSAMRERAFPSTFEDDESDAFPDTYDERYLPPSQLRGRSYGQDTRSRSQSLATTTRPGNIGNPFAGVGMWGESTNPLNVPAQRYGEIQPPGNSRYGSLGTSGRSLSNNFVSPSNNGYSTGGANEVSNMSPFQRDVGAILLDEGSAFRELWAGMNPPRDENGGGGSGTTSRRHSVSVVQPQRRGNAVLGFNAPGADDEPARPALFTSKSYGRGGLMLSDDDLAGDLGMLDLNYSKGPGPASALHHPVSQPASLPIYAPLSRSPPSERLAPYQSINLAIPAGSSFPARPHRGSPSESGLSAGSPTRSSNSPFDLLGADAGYGAQQQQLTARFIPGQGIQYLPPSHANGAARAGSASYAASPLSPSAPRGIAPQQGPQYAPQLQRRPSDAGAAAPLSELGKGVPLHSVPAAWPLCIVEFKAGRTDLFYSTDPAADIRVGDLVLVEADRGKDLGTVVNDSITLQEVEQFQREQQARAGFGDAPPMSPDGNGSGGAGGGGPAPGAKKEINPKMIYGKAQAQDTQYVVLVLLRRVILMFFAGFSWSSRRTS